MQTAPTVEQTAFSLLLNVIRWFCVSSICLHHFFPLVRERRLRAFPWEQTPSLRATGRRDLRAEPSPGPARLGWQAPAAPRPLCWQQAGDGLSRVPPAGVPPAGDGLIRGPFPPGGPIPRSTASRLLLHTRLLIPTAEAQLPAT